MKTIITILDEKRIKVGEKTVSRFTCEVTRKDGTKHMINLSEGQLTEIYIEANEKCVEFVVNLEEVEELILTKKSFEEVNSNKFDVYTHNFNLSDIIDYGKVIAEEECIVVNKRRLIKMGFNPL